MKQFLYTVVLMCSVAATSSAQPDVGVREVKLSRNAGFVQLSMDVSIGGSGLDRNSVVVVTPRLVGQNDSVDFPEVAVFGRNTYYYNVRTGETPGAGPAAYKIRYKGGPRTEHYARSIEHQPWMNNSVLKLITAEGVPCNLADADAATMPGFNIPPPDTTYVVTRRSKKQEQTGRVSGQARITFRVNRTEIVPGLYDNRQELEKIQKAIREVQANKDVQITRYTLKGYASPEGSYANNTRLAVGRTEALRQYMVKRWGVPADQIKADYEPEDWAGFRQYVQEHRDELRNPDAILQIIDLPLEPDPKLARIAAEHPQDYRHILERCFPPLRRTDYTIDYDWLRVVDADDGEDRQMLIDTHGAERYDSLEADVHTLLTPTHPWLAVKTNLLFDALLAPNFELEAQLGRDSRWSIMLEDWFPWWLYSRNPKGDTNPYRRRGHKAFRSAYEVWLLGAELRYWFAPRCRQSRPTLTGTFVGLYAAGGKYDWERHSKGDQGEFTSFGLTLGHSWALSRAWNLELSASAGYVGGPRRHYHGEFDDTHLIWKYSGRNRYVGPTKLKLSLAWLIPDKKKSSAYWLTQKGGLQ